MSLINSEPAAWNARHLRLAIDAAGVALWSWNVDTDKLTMDGHGYDLWGVERSELFVSKTCQHTSILPIAIGILPIAIE